MVDGLRCENYREMFLRRQRLECVWRAVERIWERKREEKKSRVKRPGSVEQVERLLFHYCKSGGGKDGCFFKKLFIYFIFGCVGSSLLCEGFL